MTPAFSGTREGSADNASIPAPITALAQMWKKVLQSMWGNSS
jgi:hypothetical protein